MPSTSHDSAAVYVIDDDVSFLKSVSRLLSAVGYTVQAFGSAEAFLNQLAPDMTGCIVADLQMPGMDGLKLQQALAKTTNPLPIIFLTGQGDIPTSVSAMRSGAEDFLTKRAPKEDLLAAIERALERDRIERKERGRVQDLRHRFEDLSERELEVLGHVVQGKMNKEIAAYLNINERTVKLHRTNITRKLKVHSVAELTRLADEAKLFDPGKESIPRAEGTFPKGQ
ncbi:MAG TPA: response regulator [Candidatus Acidoferrales bacterium]|nr:response regulator [Candidatus Acidoferrales bacterium]